jgi:hypothetical protein
VQGLDFMVDGSDTPSEIAPGVSLYCRLFGGRHCCEEESPSM